MQLTSISFMLFAAVLLLVYYLVPKKLQWCLLLFASYVFYLWAGVQYLVFILFTTITTWLATTFIARQYKKQECFLTQNELTRDEKKACKAATKKRCKAPMLVCVFVNFAVLAVCKFLITEPFSSAAKDGAFSFLTVGIPLGISFYMFQSIGYVVDVYRGSIKAEKNPLKLALFVSYFPQLIQGPISRFSQLAPQLYAPHPFDGKELSFGLQRMLWGYFKKLVIADRIAAAVIVLRGPEFTGVGFFLLSIGYAIQIYADFTGGIDIVIGLSQAFGIRLTENFHRPFFSKNIAEYWRRWHISLGEWMKGYIFNPISVSAPMLKLSKAARKKLGSFGKRLPVYIATFATWFVTGIWHGITPNFILWGMMNCVVIVLSEELQPLYQKFHNKFGFKGKAWYAAFEMLRMFLLMNFIRVIDLFSNVGEYFSRMCSLVTDLDFCIFTDGSLETIPLTGLDYCILLGGITAMFAVSVIQERKGSIRQILWAKPRLRYILVIALLMIVLLMGSYGIGYNANDFIYNQF